MRNSKPGWRVLFLLIAWMAMAQSVISDERTTQLFGGDSLRSAADYLKDRNGHAMLVYHRDKLVFEEYFNGWSADKPHRLASGTKSFSGAMLAAAVEDGLLKLDEKVADTIVEWKGMRASRRSRFDTCCHSRAAFMAGAPVRPLLPTPEP